MAMTEMTITGDKREIPDRRIKDQPMNYNRRIRPDRRLNNIGVEELHPEVLIRHPLIWLEFRRLGYGKKRKDRT